MKPRLADLWTWQGEIKRGPFLFWGLLLGALKYNLDRLLMWHWSGQRWSLLDYTKLGEYLWPRVPSFENAGQFAVMLALALPFMTVGVLLTLKRLRSIHLSPWLVLLFFVPVVKIIFFLLLCVLPSRERLNAEAQRGGGLKSFLGLIIPRSRVGSAAAGILFATASSAVCVWLGTSVENQEWADKRIPHLLAAPARIRFLSCEPLLGALDLSHHAKKKGIHWIITGGESGKGSRPMHPDWVRSLRDFAFKQDIAFHFKQWGNFAPAPKGGIGQTRFMFPDDVAMIARSKAINGRKLDGRTHDAFPA